MPEGQETQIEKERTASVLLNPGDDGEFGAYVGGIISWFSPRYRVSYVRYLTYASGPLEGNYVGMAEKSDNWKLMHEASFVLDSSKDYRAGEFSFPFVLSLKAQVPTHGLNTPKQSFVELFR